MVKTSFRGTHNWPEASEFAGKEVQFLEHEHRHTFHVKAELTVEDSDREVEFFVFQDQVDRAIHSVYEHKGFVYVLGRRSCETIAEEIIEALRTHCKHTGTIALEVWEDNEVGGRVVSVPEPKSENALTEEQLQFLFPELKKD